MLSVRAESPQRASTPMTVARKTLAGWLSPFRQNRPHAQEFSNGVRNGLSNLDLNQTKTSVKASWMSCQLVHKTDNRSSPLERTIPRFQQKPFFYDLPIEGLMRALPIPTALLRLRRVACP
jgi:hypothetical protein